MWVVIGGLGQQGCGLCGGPRCESALGKEARPRGSGEEGCERWGSVARYCWGVADARYVSGWVRKEVVAAAGDKRSAHHHRTTVIDPVRSASSAGRASAFTAAVSRCNLPEFHHVGSIWRVLSTTTVPALDPTPKFAKELCGFCGRTIPSAVTFWLKCLLLIFRSTTGTRRAYHRVNSMPLKLICWLPRFLPLPLALGVSTRDKIYTTT